MKTVLVYPDVPAGLIDCIRMIDYSRMSREDINSKLRQLEELAATKLPIRQTHLRPSAPVVVPTDTPDGGIALINKFYYGHLTRGQISLAYGLINMWIRANLPTR